MEELQKVFGGSIFQSEDSSSLVTAISSTFHKAKESLSSSSSSAAAASNPPPPPPPPELPPLVLTRAPRHAISLLTCSKLCGIFFVAGVIVGYTLKRRVRRWAAKLLRRVKDD